MGILLLILAQSALPSILLLSTQKRSLLRPIWIASSSYLAYLLFLPPPKNSTGPPRGTMSAGHVVLAMIQAVNVLISSPLNRDDLVRAGIFETSSHFLVQVCRTMSKIFFCPRGINTPWQVKSLPTHPRHLIAQAQPGIPRWSFLGRQAAILAWQYLALSALVTVDSQADSLLGSHSAAAADNWALRTAVVFIVWFIALRLVIDSGYRALSVVAIALTTSAPEDWPPLFGRMRDAYTLRGFWGKFWHQLLRRALTAFSSHLTQRIMRLSRPSVLERYINILVVFTISGAIHLAGDREAGVSIAESRAMVFFPLFMPLFMIEDGVQHLWRRFCSSSPSSAICLWQRVLGYLWVIMCLSAISPQYLIVGRRVFLEPLKATGLFDAISCAGAHILVGASVLGGLLLQHVYETEV
ncbi:membrane bound O-acyl transferase family-domain-containing protein [Aspergillus karnatakaensis]|uniref:wax synthase family protein n=1 Tax=Aspergillus karnatakaensis TaxID=1810916 RepID=UPI003CCE4158